MQLALFVSRREIMCMQTLVIITAGVLGHGHEEYRSVRPGSWVDYRCGSNADRRRDLRAAIYHVAGCFIGTKNGLMPQRGQRVCIERVYRVVFRSYKQNVVNRAVHGQAS